MIRVAGILLSGLLSGLLTMSIAAGETRFRVSVPKDTPADATLFVSGSPPALGGWKADGLQLKRDGERWVGSVELPDGPFEWKVTLGSWDRCEVAADGSARANRTSTAAKGSVFEATVERWRSTTISIVASTATGDIRIVGPIVSDNPAVASRSVLVRLPTDYDAPASKDRRYRVVYFLDGQNVFDAATSFAGVEWQADEAVDALVRDGAIEPTILVAIPNSPQRMAELTFVRDNGRKAGGDGEAFLAWMIERVKARIDADYRTQSGRDATTIVGSSLGGLFALEAITRRGDVFGRAVAMSPSLWWSDEELLRRWTPSDAKRPAPIALWMDTGTAEDRDAPNGHVERAKRLGELLKSLPRTRMEIVVGGTHHESAWAKRLPEALRFVLKND